MHKCVCVFDSLFVSFDHIPVVVTIVSEESKSKFTTYMYQYIFFFILTVPIIKNRLLILLLNYSLYILIKIFEVHLNCMYSPPFKNTMEILKTKNINTFLFMLIRFESFVVSANTTIDNGYNL